MHCAVCGEPITNPISESRLQEQLSYWLREVAPELKTLDIKALFAHFPSEEMCIITKQAIRVCSFCFAKEARELLVAKAPHLREAFDMAFNYEIYPSTGN